MTSIKEKISHKLNNLSPEQLQSVHQFVELLESQPQSIHPQHPIITSLI